jgi:LysR family transcriptional regulator, nod-box dependent transcriptional activator
MRLNRFDLNMLIALDALLRERNVTRAAERVYVSQPAMSAALARLRDYFRDPLLVRVGRDFELTPRGRTLAGPVQQMLLDAQAVLGVQAVFDPSLDHRTVSVMSSDLFTPWLIPPLLRRLEKSAPGIGIQLERPSIAGLARLVHGDIHLALAVDSSNSPPLANLPDVLCRKFVATVPWVGLAAADHPAMESELTREQFLSLPHIVMRDYGEPSLLEKTVRKRHGVELNVRVATESAFDIPHLLAGTTLIGVVPVQLARLLRGSSRIKTFELPEGLMPPSRLDLMWHRCHEPDAGHAWLRGFLRPAPSHDESFVVEPQSSVLL